MDEFETLVRKLEDDSRQYQDMLNGIAGLVEIAPQIQHLKDDTEIKRALLHKVPRDKTKLKLNEFLKHEEGEDRILKPILPSITQVDKLFVQAVEGTAGSPTNYVVMATNAILENEASAETDNVWVYDVQKIVEEHTKNIQQRTNLPERLNRLNRNLGESFKVVQDSFAKSQNKIAGVDATAIQMRGILYQIWGGILNIARVKNINSRIQVDNLEFKKPKDRILVSDILKTDLFPKTKLSSLLDDAYKLSSNLSDRHFGKDPLNQNREKLKIYYSQWISIINDISGIVS